MSSIPTPPINFFYGILFKIHLQKKVQCRHFCWYKSERCLFNNRYKRLINLLNNNPYIIFRYIYIILMYITPNSDYNSYNNLCKFICDWYKLLIEYIFCKKNYFNEISGIVKVYLCYPSIILRVTSATLCNLQFTPLDIMI